MKYQFNKRLPEALQLAITALKDDTFPYSWKHASKCNCGVVVSAMMSESPTKTIHLFNDAKEAAGLPDSENPTWRKVCQHSCYVTGEPMTEIFKKLKEFGLSPKDVVHLEYMNNKAILKEAGMRLRWAGYYKRKSNLIDYLEAWLRIINKTSKRNFSKQNQLEADILIAAALKVRMKKYDNRQNNT